MPLPFDQFQPFRKAADVDGDARQFRSHRLHGRTKPASCVDGAAGHIRLSAAAAIGTAGQARLPRGGDLRLQLAAGEIGKQPLTRLDGG